MTEPNPDDRSLAARWAWAFVPLSIVLLDLHFQWRDERIAFVALNPLSYLLSTTASFLFWMQLPKLFRFGKVGVGIAIGATSAMAFLCQTVWQTYRLRRMGFGAGDIVYFLEEPGNTFSLVADASDWLVVPTVILTAGFWFAAIVHSRTTEPADRVRTAVGSALVPVCLVGALYVSPAFPPLGADARAVYSIASGAKHYANGIRSYVQGVAKREVPKEISSTSPPNILLIIGESIRRDHFAVSTTMERETTPRLSGFTKEHSENVHVFNRHVPNSASTFFALTGITLGQYQTVDRETFNTSPTVWQYANAAGMKTFVASAQSWAWAGLHDSLIQEQAPDWYADIDVLGFPQVNDTGADDLAVARSVGDWIQKNGETPFLGVVQLNSTHFPFHAADDSPWPIETETDRYDASVIRTDQAVGLLLDQLEADGLLDRTVVFFVSDHAEGLLDNYDDAKEASVRAAEPEYITGSRSQSCDPLFINAPLLVYVPSGLAPIPVANRDRVTSHVDFLPTILGYIGYPEPELVGFAWQKPIPEDRVAYCFTTGATSRFEFSGFGARRGNDYVYQRADFQRAWHWDLSNGDVSTRHLNDAFGPTPESLVKDARGAWPEYVGFVIDH